MTAPLATAAPPRPPPLRWRCPVCKVLLALRPTTENEDSFRERCAAHEACIKVCRAKVLAAQLLADGFVSLRSADGLAFGIHYEALKGAGLVTRHMTHIHSETYVTGSPWGPGWAVLYSDYLLWKCLTPLVARSAALAEAAASPETIEQCKAFLALGHGYPTKIDRSGCP